MDLRRLVIPGVLIAVLAACATPVPTSRSAASQEPVEFVADGDRMHADLAALQAAADANGGIRASGTPGYEASVDHVAAALEDIGFEVTLPEVSFVGFTELPGTRLEVAGTVVEGADELHALIYSPGGDVTGPVAVLSGSGCDAADFASIPDGAIAVTTMGGCFRRDQAVNAAAAGAVALIVGYPGRGPGEIFRPTLIDPEGIEIPVVSVTGETVDLLADADEAHLVVATEREASTLRNVIAQLGDGPSVVMLGAHLDSVLDGPGINDNGTGVAALLEVARGLAAAGVPEGWAVRIGLWGGEEFGTIGSRAYAETLGDEVTAYLNLDMTGSVNGANLIYDEAGAPPGSGTSPKHSTRGSPTTAWRASTSISEARATTSASRRPGFRPAASSRARPSQAPHRSRARATAARRWTRATTSPVTRSTTSISNASRSSPRLPTP